MIIVCDENLPGLQRLEQAGHQLRRLPGRAIDAAALGGAEALLVRSVTRVDDALLRGSRLRFVGTATSGTDHVDRGALEAAGIPFACAPGANANSVVEYVLCAVLAHPGRWSELESGAPLGIVGYGHIGRALRARCAAIGFSTRIFDPWLDPGTVPDAAPLEAVLHCPVVSLHPELTDQQPFPSRHLLDRNTLAAISDEALLINASRGPVVHGGALLDRLRHGRGPTTVLDVWEHEPQLDTQLLERVSLGTAHIAGYSWDAKLKATHQLLDALDAALGLGLPAFPAAAGAPGLALAAPPADASKEAIARALLTARYAISEDDARLRRALAPLTSPAARAQAFDALRRDYPRRRELYGSGLHSEGWSDTARQVAQALGCKLEH